MALTGDEITLTLCMMEQQEEVTLPAHLRVTHPPSCSRALAALDQACGHRRAASFAKLSSIGFGQDGMALGTQAQHRPRQWSCAPCPASGQEDYPQRPIFSGSSDHLAHGCRYRTKRHRSLHNQITRAAMNRSSRKLAVTSPLPMLRAADDPAIALGPGVLSPHSRRGSPPCYPILNKLGGHQNSITILKALQGTHYDH